MENMVFGAHSGVRYLVLLAGVLALLLAGLATRPAGTGVLSAERIASRAFVGLLDLQVLLGLVLFFLRDFYGALIGHVVLMIAVVVAAHVGLAKSKRQTEPAAGAKVRAIAFALALLLIVFGIHALMRPIL